MFENYKDVLNIKELSQMLNIGKNKAYELINSGEIKSFKIGKVHKIPKIWIIDYIQIQWIVYWFMKIIYTQFVRVFYVF